MHHTFKLATNPCSKSLSLPPVAISYH